VRFRIRTINRLETALRRYGSGRWQMLLILLGTGGAGFLCSYALLHLGVAKMGLRYLLAVTGAYGVFLLLLWAWVGYHRRASVSGDDFFELPDIRFRTTGGARGSGEPPLSFGGGRAGGGGAGGSFETPQAGLAVPIVPPDGPAPDIDLDAGGRSGSGSSGASGGRSGSGTGSGSFDLKDAKPEGLALLVVILALAAAAIASVCASVYVLHIAPHMMAEILFDGALMAGLYARLKHAPRQHWLSHAIGHTWFPAVVTGLAFLLAGAVIQHVLPTARSIGDVVRVLTGP
jgi:hypothetical protein